VAGNVWILGGYPSDFACNLTREGRDFAALTSEVAGAHRFGALNFGGSTATTVSFVIRSADDAH
jgi:hypothetical protein